MTARAVAGATRSGLARVAGTGAGAGAVLAVLVAAAVCFCVAVPRLSLHLRTAALQRLVAGAPATARSVVGSIDLPTYASAFAITGQGPLTVPEGQVEVSAAQIARNLAATRLPLQAGAAWSGMASAYMTVVSGAAKSAYNGTTPPQVELLDRQGLGARARVLAGTLPSRSRVTAGSARFEVAVTAATARRFGLRPGAAVTLGALTARGTVLPVTLVVTGILRPRVPRSSFWTADPDAAAATWNVPEHGEPYWVGGAFVSDAEFTRVQAAIGLTGMRAMWDFPLALGGVSAGQAGALSGEIAAGLLTAGTLTHGLGTLANVQLTCGIAASLGQFARSQGQVGSLLSLLQVSLALVGIVALWLGCRLVAERRSAEFGVIMARGGARRQVAGAALGAACLLALPAAAAGAAAGLALTPGPGEPAAWDLAVATVLVPLAAVPWLALRCAAPAGHSAERAERRPSRAARARRAVAEAALCLAAAGSLVVLRQQGTPAAGGTDWYTSAAPVLVAVPAAVLVARAYPVAVRWLARLAGRRQAVTAFVGFARAARASLAATAPAFALMLVVSVIAFGAMVRTCVARGDAARSWRAVGADVVINASGSDLPVTAATMRAIAAVPGVRRTSALAVQSALAADGSSLGVVIVSPASYAALLAATPAARFPAAALARRATGAPVPALVSPGAVASVRAGRVLLDNRLVSVRVAGTVPAVPGAPVSGPFIVLAARAAAGAVGAGQVRPDVVLAVGQGIDAARLRSVARARLPGSALAFRAALLASLAGAPLPHAASVVFAAGAGAAAAFGAVIIMIMLALGARARELTLARLFTMGMSPGQARRLVAAEALPWIVAAAAGGAACAWALVPLVGPGIDLSPLTGSGAPVPVRADAPAIGLLAGCLLALALAALAAHAALARARGAVSVLRAGE